MKIGGKLAELVTILMSAQFLKISAIPQPTASVPLSQVPHIFPENKLNINNFVLNMSKEQQNSYLLFLSKLIKYFYISMVIVDVK
jgi:hypothetical protein